MSWMNNVLNSAYSGAVIKVTKTQKFSDSCYEEQSRVMKVKKAEMHKDGKHVVITYAKTSADFPSYYSYNPATDSVTIIKLPTKKAGV